MLLSVGAVFGLCTSGAASAMPLGPWLPDPALAVSSPSSGDWSPEPQVAIGPDGATEITWTARESTSGDYDIFAARLAVGAIGFGPADSLAFDRAMSGEPQIAVAADGSSTVTWWSQGRGRSQHMEAATRAAGATAYGEPVVVSAVSHVASSPRIAAAAGRTTIVWIDDFEFRSTVQAATRAAGAAAFGSPVPASAADTATRDLQIATGRDGTTAIVWVNGDSTSGVVRVATRAAGADAFGVPVPVSLVGRDASAPQLAVGPDGAMTVVWVDGGYPARTLQVASRAAGAETFGGPSPLTLVADDASEPQLAIGPDGTTTIAWTAEGPPRSVRAATRAPGASAFGDAVAVAVDPSRDAQASRIATGLDGTTTVTWQTNDPVTGDYNVMAVTRAAGAAAFGEPSDLGNAGWENPQQEVATGPDGTVAVTWKRLTGDGSTVQAVTATPSSSVLTVAKVGDGTVVSTPTGIDCGSICSATYPNLTPVTLTATPAAGSVFTGWTGACAGTGACTVAMTQARTVTASFERAEAQPASAAGSTASARPATPRRIVWSRIGSTQQQLRATFAAAEGTAYAITATLGGGRRTEGRASRTARGSCTIRKGAQTGKRTATCTIRLRRAGLWRVQITPAGNGRVGAPATRFFEVRTPKAAEPVTG